LVDAGSAQTHTAADIERVFEGVRDRPDTGLVLLPNIFTTTKSNSI